MDPHEFLEAPIEYSFSQLKDANDDPSRLPAPLQTLILVYSAQGIIDNGGFQFFFESDWPNTPSYSQFSDAYRTIGSANIAEALDKAVALFPFENPHLNLNLRTEFMSALPETHALFQLGDSACGDDSVWVRLSEYVRQNPKAFPCA